jgi:hypothetical protein
MVNQQIVDYIKKVKSEGYNDDKIKDVLKQQGYSESLISESFKVVDTTVDKPEVLEKNTQSAKDHLGFNKEGLIYFSGIIICAVGLLLTLMLRVFGLIVNLIGLIMIFTTIVMNFNEKSSIGVKIGGLVMKFIVFGVFLTLTFVVNALLK